MITVYAITSKNRKYIYVGMTNSLERRLRQHNAGYEKITRAYIPFVVIYREDFDDRITARNKEKYLKSGFGKEFLKTL